MLEIFAADADVGFVPAGRGVGTVTVPFTGMENDDGAATDGDALSALELDRAFTFAYV